jgi:hypothetical protein
VRAYDRKDPEYPPPADYRIDQAREFVSLRDGRFGTIKDERYTLSRFAYSRRKSKLPRPFKAVEHTRKVIKPYGDNFTFVESVDVGGFYPYTDTSTVQTSPINWLCERIGIEGVEAMINSFNPDVSGYVFHHPDWFSIVSEFNETVDQLMPSSFFGGEAMMESPIYGHVLKAITNPKKHVLGLIKDVVRRGISHQNLGQVRKYYASRVDKHAVRTAFRLLSSGEGTILSSSLRAAIDAHLTFKFGVEPALSEVASMIASHASVDVQLDRLKRNAGRYLPIRVRRKIPSSFDSSITATPYVDYLWRQSDQHLVAVMSAMGRVREDINEASRWRAYTEYFGLNKVVGTAWELIPFSFVVDWVTNAQERLNDLTRIRLGDSPFYNLVGIGSSVKQVLQHQLCITPGYDTTYGMQLDSDSPIPVLSVETSKYTRIPGLPDTSGVVDISTLGLFHGVTGIELLLQKSGL